LQSQLTKPPVAKVEMLVRRPVPTVFAAFVDPAITTRFWFTRSTGRLEAGETVEWTWEMYGHTILVKVEAIEPNRRIRIAWGPPGTETTVEWSFIPYEEDATFVTIVNSGFAGDADELVQQALNSKGGFTWVLAGAKAWLEHGIELNLVADAFPKGLREH
jgi:uncharacterized protein YndB with AHSA1/START domain